MFKCSRRYALRRRSLVLPCLRPAGALPNSDKAVTIICSSAVILRISHKPFTLGHHYLLLHHSLVLCLSFHGLSADREAGQATLSANMRCEVLCQLDEACITVSRCLVRCTASSEPQARPAAGHHTPGLSVNAL